MFTVRLLSRSPLIRCGRPRYQRCRDVVRHPRAKFRTPDMVPRKPVRFWACWARCDRVIAGIGSRAHGRIRCLRLAGEKSGQVLVRTLEGENPSQMRLGCKSRTGISRWGRGSCERHPDGRLKKRTGFGSPPAERKPKPDAAGPWALRVPSAVTYSGISCTIRLQYR